jgi:hypothetical protein
MIVSLYAQVGPTHALFVTMPCETARLLDCVMSGNGALLDVKQTVRQRERLDIRANLIHPSLYMCAVSTAHVP